MSKQLFFIFKTSLNCQQDSYFVPFQPRNPIFKLSYLINLSQFIVEVREYKYDYSAINKFNSAYQSMSKHSNIQSQNQQAPFSHCNSPPVLPIAHSEQPRHIHNPNSNKEWIAMYMDGQYFLTDPDSINKLKNIEAEIEAQRQRLLKLEQDNLSNNNSFLSYQEELAEKQSNKSNCITEFNHSRHLNLQQKFKQELQKQQELYRQKIKNSQKQKIELKKNMKLLEKKQSQKNQTQNKQSPSRKKSSHKNIDALIPQIQESKKYSVKLSQKEGKQKSYHKSRIQQSIKDNIELNEEAVNHSPSVRSKRNGETINDLKFIKEQIKNPNDIEKSKKESVKPPSQVQKSIKIIIEKPNIQVKQPQKSVKKSIKKTEKISNFEKNQLDQPQSIKNQEPSKVISQKHSSIKKKEIVTLIENQKSHIQIQKSVKSPSSKRSSSKHSNKQQGREEAEIQLLRIKQTPIDANAETLAPKSIRQKSKKNEETERKYQMQIDMSKVSQKSLPRSNRVLEHQIFKEQEIKSRKSHIIDQIKSKKSHIPIQEESKSKKSKINNETKKEQEVISKKSSAKPTVQIVPIAQHKVSVGQKKIEKSQQQKSQIISKKSQKNQISSKKSNKSQKQKQQQIMNESKSIIISERNSFSKKSAMPPIEILQTKKNPTQEMINKSIQWENLEQNQGNQEQYNQSNISDKNKSFLNNNEGSLYQSSCVKIQMPNNELQPETAQEIAPQINMKKKKQEQVVENQSEKRSKSFVIHSRQGSVKDRSQKNNEKLNNSKISSPSCKSKGKSAFNESSVIGNQSVTKEQMIKLHQQISILQEKLKKVEQRQQQMQKLQGTLSKIQHMQNQSEHKQFKTITERLATPQTPLAIDNLAEVSIAVRPRLQIQSSILQVNTTEEMQKKQQKQSEHNQKTKLKEEIGRLKKIIRDMQIEKIKSIDHQSQPPSPLLKQKGSKEFDGKQSRQIDRQSRVQKQSINSEGFPRRLFGSNNKRLLQDAGKIIHNSNPDKLVQSPRKRSINRIKLMGNEDDVVTDAVDLPNETNRKNANAFYSEVRKNEYSNRIGQKDRDFHNFIQSSRVIAEEHSNYKQDAVDSLTTSFNNFNKFTVAQDAHNNNLSKVNYSRMVEEMKKNNPEQEQVLPEIHLRDIKMPYLPQCPNTNMTQQQLLALAKATYLVFGINVEQEDKQLCVKKYKNCVIFTINNQNHECILWHFSGKFYMGGWRTGEPGEGQKDGEGLQLIPDKHIYKGQFLNGKKNGTGILKLSNGNIYDGQWIQGIKNGRGVYLDAATKVIYSGQWRDGKKQGQGYLKLSEKEFYYGTFVKSIKEGFGVEVFVNGDKYKGEYKNGKFHGKGKYLWANGSCYQGQFNEGVRHGHGSWKSAKINGDIYIGTYDGDKKNGYGRYVWANGCMYEGGFSHDLKHGKGRLTYQDGKEIKGVWQEGNLMSTQSQKREAEHEDQPLRRSVKISSFGYPSSLKRI